MKHGAKLDQMSVLRKLASFWGLLFCVTSACFSAKSDQASDRHVLLVVWDGMRPDFVTESNSPTLWKLAQGGVRFLNHHSVYLSATEVNGTAINTGGYPAHDGIVANSEYRPIIDPLRSIHTELPPGVRKGDQLTKGHYLKMPTIAEIVREAGDKTAVAAAKSIGLLPDRAERSSAEQGANVFAGSTLPEGLLSTLTNALGPFPKDGLGKPTRNDWTAQALTEHLWSAAVPKFSLLWLNNPDGAQHTFGPGSPQALAGIRDADNNLARALAALERKGIRDSTDVMVVSDHGFSTCIKTVDLAAALEKEGFKASREFKTKPEKDEILVVSNSGSSVLYVIGHSPETIRKVVQFLQQWQYAGVIFSREKVAGSFSLAQAHLNSGEAPDMIVSLRWTRETNRFAVPGSVYADKSAFTPGQGVHVSLSPYDMHATLVAAGPDFQAGLTSTIASGNTDIAPTILHVLGIRAPQAMDGRVLKEALKGAPSAKRLEAKSETIEASASNSQGTWHQYLKISKVEGVEYFDEGNGGWTAK